MKKLKPLKYPWANMGKISPMWGRGTIVALLICQLPPSNSYSFEYSLKMENHFLFQQKKLYTGTVKDVDGNILQGVSISLKDQKTL